MGITLFTSVDSRNPHSKVTFLSVPLILFDLPFKFKFRSGMPVSKVIF